MDFQATEFLGAAQRSALLALGRTGGTPSERKKLRRGKLLEMYTESPASSARCVGRACPWLRLGNGQNQ